MELEADRTFNVCLNPFFYLFRVGLIYLSEIPDSFIMIYMNGIGQEMRPTDMYMNCDFNVALDFDYPLDVAIYEGTESGILIAEHHVQGS